MSMETVSMNIIARIHTDFASKFGVPKQSGIVSDLKGRIVFEPEYRNADAVRGLEEFSHIWILWQFSGAVRQSWSPTVRPPRLGGNRRIGVFASRSPFRPNHIGLSSVQLERVEISPEYGPVLHVLGADLMDGTPIFDIKPYIAYADSHPEATGGFTDRVQARTLEPVIPPELLGKVPGDKRDALLGVLAHDPRPTYQDDPERIYGFGFGGMEIKFRAAEGKLYVLDIQPEQ